MNYIGIDLGGTNIKGALVSEQGEILREHAVETRVDLGPEAIAARIGQVIAQLCEGTDESAVGGVGVGCPGTVDDASGIVRFAGNLGFVNFDLRGALRAHTALPIHLGNDANAAALGRFEAADVLCSYPSIQLCYGSRAAKDWNTEIAVRMMQEDVWL